MKPGVCGGDGHGSGRLAAETTWKLPVEGVPTEELLAPGTKEVASEAGFGPWGDHLSVAWPDADGRGARVTSHTPRCPLLQFVYRHQEIQAGREVSPVRSMTS